MSLERELERLQRLCTAMYPRENCPLRVELQAENYAGGKHGWEISLFSPWTGNAAGAEAIQVIQRDFDTLPELVAFLRTLKPFTVRSKQ